MIAADKARAALRRARSGLARAPRTFRPALLRRSVLYGVVVACCGVVAFPVVWMVITSLKTEQEAIRVPPTLWPLQLTFAAYREVWELKNFARYFLNSLITACATTLLTGTLAALAGYGFTRFRIAGHGLLLRYILLAQMFPAILLVIPYFVAMSHLQLTNTYTALILAYTSFALPFSTWMLIGYFRSIPKELDEAALVDGCTPLGAFARVALPLAAPGLVATGLFTFLLAWSEYLFPLVLATSSDMYVLPVAVASFVQEFRILYTHMMAASVIVAAPVVFLYIVLERFLVGGLAAGAVKG